jgi:hypothetical protein
MPRNPALSASPEQLMKAEEGLDIAALVTQGLRGTTLEKFNYSGGQVEVTEQAPIVKHDRHQVTAAR